MRKNVILGLITATAVVFGSFSASALELNIGIVGVFTDSSFSTPAPGVTVSGGGDTATGTMVPGYVILMAVTVGNAANDNVTGVFTTMTHQAEDVDFLGPSAPGSILAEGGFGGDSLGDVGTGAIKGNTPNPDGGVGDVWVQALAYGAAGGATGAGVDTINLAYTYTGPNQTFSLTHGLTDGDGIGGASSVDFGQDTVTFNIPEPGTALLMGLGLVGLAGAGRRKS